ncbi:hypothetical protein [Streptomyces sp. RG80]|uniref:hypothetical protein n=1 Tax=Streptomyces sp. RG80 TaxID=3157340 RepID=UPI00338E1E8D
MSASPAVRSLRAAVFAVLCVLLAAGGHGLATGTAPPVRVQVAGGLGVFAVACLLGGRERSLAGIGGGTTAAQGGLHLAFGAARPHPSPVLHGQHPTTVVHGPHPSMLMHGMRMAPHSHALTSHATAAHVGAALVLTWWLRRGEAALWSLLRWAVALVPGLAAWWRVASGFRAVPAAPRPVCRAADGTRSPRQVWLRHSVHRRGPPAGMSYAV